MQELHDKIKEKEGCPSNCPFIGESIEPVVIPAPKEIAGIVVSRDPPRPWYCVYRYCMEHDPDAEGRRMLYSNGIPQGVCTRIRDFLAKDCTEDCWSRVFQPLYNLLYEKTYWTHLNKCFTGGGKPGYKKSVAQRCADTWLHEDLYDLKALGARFVIALERDVQAWIGKNALHGIEIINLFHTSRRNNNIWFREKTDNKTVIAQRKENGRNIKKLFEFVNVEKSVVKELI